MLAGVKDPPFTVLLRYLLLVHAQPSVQAAAGAAALLVPVDPCFAELPAATTSPGGAGGSGAPAAAAGAGKEPCSGEEDLICQCRALLLPERDPAPLLGEAVTGPLPESHVQVRRRGLGRKRSWALLAGRIDAVG